MRVVIFVTRQRPHQWPRVSFRTKSKVDAEQHPLRRHLSDLSDERLSQPFEKLMIRQTVRRRRFWFRRLLEKISLFAINEQHIHIRAVIEFLTTELAQAQHTELSALPSTAQIKMIRLPEAARKIGVTKLQHGSQADIGNIRNLAGDLRDVGQPREITSGDPQHFPLFKLTQLREGRLKVAGLPYRRQPGTHFPLQALFLARRPQRIRGEPFGNPLRMGGQQLGGGHRSAEQGNEYPCLFQRRVFQRAGCARFREVMQTAARTLHLRSGS